jgi:hypothetical protein
VEIFFQAEILLLVILISLFSLVFRFYPPQGGIEKNPGFLSVYRG